jgi:hypothetical protein
MLAREGFQYRHELCAGPIDGSVSCRLLSNVSTFCVPPLPFHCRQVPYPAGPGAPRAGAAPVLLAAPRAAAVLDRRGGPCYRWPSVGQGSCGHRAAPSVTRMGLGWVPFSSLHVECGLGLQWRLWSDT